MAINHWCGYVDADVDADVDVDNKPLSFICLGAHDLLVDSEEQD